MENKCQQCSGRGWLLCAVNGDAANMQIERCDTCQIFNGDSQAIEFVAEQMLMLTEQCSDSPKKDLKGSKIQEHIRAALERVLDYLVEDEHKHYIESDCPENHIYRDIEILQDFIENKEKLNELAELERKLMKDGTRVTLANRTSIVCGTIDNSCFMAKNAGCGVNGKVYVKWDDNLYYNSTVTEGSYDISQLKVIE